MEHVLKTFVLFFSHSFNEYNFSEKVFSYLNADEIEKLRAEEERKIAGLSAADISSINELDNSDGESVESQRSR